MVTTEASIEGQRAATQLIPREVVGDPVVDGAVDYDPPYVGTVDLDVEEAIMQRVSIECISGSCAVRQWQLAHELAPQAAPGGRISPEIAASLILQRMRCPNLKTDLQARVRLTE